MSDGIKINVDNICKKFGDNVIALDNVSLNFDAGALHGVIGPAGAGKTTLLRLILQLLDQDSGTITFLRGNTVLEFNNIKNTIAYMPEQQSLYADLSIKEHLEFFSTMYGLSNEQYTTKSKSLLEMTRLDKFQDRQAGKLSGRMYKKLGLMCALLRSPDVILLDEPTNGVDPISRREFWEILNDAASQNITVIMTTAYMDEAERCEYVHLMEDGHVLAEGEPRELLSAENVDNFDEFFIKRWNCNEVSI